MSYHVVSALVPTLKLQCTYAETTVYLRRNYSVPALYGKGMMKNIAV